MSSSNQQSDSDSNATQHTIFLAAPVGGSGGNERVIFAEFPVEQIDSEKTLNEFSGEIKRNLGLDLYLKPVGYSTLFEDIEDVVHQMEVYQQESEGEDAEMWARRVDYLKQYC